MKYTYRDLCVLDSTGNRNIVLMRQIETGLLAVKKIVDIDLLPVYEKICKINNPGLVRIYELELCETGCVVIEEYVAGMTLEDLVMSKGVLSERQAEDYIAQLCIAVGSMHDKKIIHRDITPRNVMITSEGDVKLCDYNISREYKSHSARDTQMLGTNGYAAPEQFGYGQSGVQSDIYAIGILANYMVTGEERTIHKNNGILCKVIERSTALDMKKRYNSIQEILSDIEVRERIEYGYAEKDDEGEFIFFEPKVYNGLHRMIKPLKWLMWSCIFFMDYVVCLFMGGNGILWKLSLSLFAVVLFFDVFNISRHLLKLDSEQRWFRCVIALCIFIIVFWYGAE